MVKAGYDDFLPVIEQGASLDETKNSANWPHGSRRRKRAAPHHEGLAQNEDLIPRRREQ
jgi:hypothetical protein